MLTQLFARPFILHYVAAAAMVFKIIVMQTLACRLFENQALFKHCIVPDFLNDMSMVMKKTK